jgi:hypothetical protein
MTGNMLTAGYKPKEAVTGGALAGLTSGLTYKPDTGSGLKLKPSDAVVDGLKHPGITDSLTGGVNSPMQADYSLAGNQPMQSSDLQMPVDTSKFILPNLNPTAAPAPAATSSLGLKDVGTMALLSQLTAQRPPAADDAIRDMSPEQQEYFNRPSITWDWNKLQSDANAQGMGLSEYMAAYWPQVTSGVYNKTTAMAMGGAYAGGGAMGAVARLVRGGGSGREDTINARLSDGEYVMDAETVAMLGDGSVDEGARRLDAMRAQLRKHKGKTLAKGKFSPNAKSPLAYLKGAA